MEKQAINFDLGTIADGGFKEKLNCALSEVGKNIINPNTDATKKRKLQINISIEPNEKRDTFSTHLDIKTTLAPELGVATTMLISKDAKGKVHINELQSGVKGQTYIDPDDGEVKTDTGEKVADVETEQEHKVVDLRKKKEN